MMLIRSDIEKIIDLGYKEEDFSYRDEDGFTKLRNINGECFFLKENKCTIYDDRPQGCKFYPIIFDIDFNKAIIDPECPLHGSVAQKTISLFEKDLRKFVRKIIYEKKK